MVRKLLFFTFHILLITVASVALDDDFNLHGIAGQAYAIEINLGRPQQKLNVLVDTGSTTLAIASYPEEDNKKYFASENSSSLYDIGKEVQAKYSQGMWIGRLVSDYIEFPSLSTRLEVRTNFALIKKSHKFFMNGSGWQGLLGLAYLPVGAWGENVIVESWLDSVERVSKKPISFQLKLCGVQNSTNATHYGNFEMIDDYTSNKNDKPMFQTPILRKRWYEIGIISIRAMTNNTRKRSFSLEDSIRNETLLNVTVEDGTLFQDPDEETCQLLNQQKSIVDSGTTNIRLPDVLFREVVDELKNAIQNPVILDEFWYHGEAACWPDPKEWTQPWLAIDLLSADSDHQYFTLEIPPQNYMRLVSAPGGGGPAGTVPQYCYKLGLEAGGRETVLGYTAMEGLQLLFNRTAGWIGWQESECGPRARVSGPRSASGSLAARCGLRAPAPPAAVSVRAAQWALCAVSAVAGGVLVYLLAPCVKGLFVKKRAPSSLQMSMSRAALFEQDTT